VADPAPAGIRGNQVTTLREGHQQIPVLTRRRLEEGARLAVVRNLYVYPSHGTQSVPMTIIASTLYAMETQRIRASITSAGSLLKASPSSGPTARRS